VQHLSALHVYMPWSMPRCLAAVSLTTCDVIGRCLAREQASFKSRWHYLNKPPHRRASWVVREIGRAQRRHWFIGSGRVRVWYRSVWHQRGVGLVIRRVRTSTGSTQIHNHLKIHAFWQWIEMCTKNKSRPSPYCRVLPPGEFIAWPQKHFPTILMINN